MVSDKTTSPREFTLDDIAPPDTIRIDDDTYRLARTTALSVRQRAQLRRAGNRMQAIEKLEEPSEADEREYRVLSEEVVHLAMPDAPAAVIAKLADEQLQQVTVAFFGRTATQSPLVRMLAETLKTQETSASISPASNGSTAVTPSAGSTSAVTS